MKSNALHFSASRKALAPLLLAGLASLPGVQAQPVYRITGADGKVTYSDRPPAAASVGDAGRAAAGGPGTGAGLPFALRQVALKYPVVLYTGDNCAPCGAGRSLLTSRGIPFSEKTISSAADTEALQRLSGEAVLPFLTIGGQQLKGFSDAEWTQFLNAAGYPTSSALPPAYRPPAPAPLVALAPSPVLAADPQAREAKPERRTPVARPVQPPTTTGNPAGIRF